jgi:hypothetical protein
VRLTFCAACGSTEDLQRHAPRHPWRRRPGLPKRPSVLKRWRSFEWRRTKALARGGPGAPPSAPGRFPNLSVEADETVVRIAISQAAFEAITKTLPLGSVGYENASNEQGERYVWLEPGLVSKLRALRGEGESYSDVILRLAADC